MNDASEMTYATATAEASLADVSPTADLTVLLNEIDEDPTGIFWG